MNKTTMDPSSATSPNPLPQSIVSSAQPKSTVNPAALTHPDILRRIITYIPLGRLPTMMRVSRTFYDTAGPQLYYKLPKTTSPKHRRLVHTLARDEPKAVIALLRHVRVIHLSDALRSQLLLAVERDGLELAFLTHLIVDDGLGIRTGGLSTLGAGMGKMGIDDITKTNDPILKRSRDLTVLCHWQDSARVALRINMWYPFRHANVRMMTITFGPPPDSIHSVPPFWPTMPLIPSTLDYLVVMLTPASGDRYWTIEAYRRSRHDPGDNLRGLIINLSEVCLAQAKRIVIVGGDRLDPRIWESNTETRDPVDVRDPVDWTMEGLERLVKAHARGIGPDTLGPDRCWPEGWEQKDIDEHVNKVEFVTRESYARGLF